MPIPWGFRLTKLYIAREFELIAELFEDIPLADRDEETKIEWRQLDEILTSLRRVSKALSDGNGHPKDVGYSLQEFEEVVAGFDGVAAAFRSGIAELRRGT